MNNFKKYLVAAILTVFTSSGMTPAFAADLLPSPVWGWVDDSVRSTSGWKINTYETDCTTRKATHSDKAATTANANPVVLNSRGEADIYWTGTYCVVITDAADATQDTINPYSASTSAASTLQGENLITNGGFELDDDGDTVPDGWTETVNTGGTVAFDTSAPMEAAQGMKFTSTGTGGGNLVSTAFIPVDDLYTYKIEFSINSSVADILNIVKVEWFTAAKATISTTTAYTDAATNPTSDTKKSISLTPAASARYAKITVIGADPSDATSGNVVYDNIRLAVETTYLGLLDTPTAYVANLVPEVNAGATAIEFIDRRTPGYRLRSNFAWASTTTFTINGGIYHLAGTSNQNVFWNAALTYTPGSGGSNSDSTDLGASETHYVYIDDSAVETLGVATALTNSEFINVTTAPTYNQTKKGWYGTAVGNLQTTDRCIFSFTTDGANNIDEFQHAGELVVLEDEAADQAAVDIDTTFTDIAALSIPGFATRAKCKFSVGTATAQFFWRTNGSSASSGHGASITINNVNISDVITDSSQIFEMKAASSNTATIAVWTQGWYFPEGM